MAALLAALLLAVPVAAKQLSVAQKKKIAVADFAAAERMREALNGRPEAQRTRREYNRVIAAYRKVYYRAPNSSKADDSVVAVAELLAEMGSRFQDAHDSEAAIGQYKFLLNQYPGTRFRVEALFTIGQIYREDLNDTEHARGAWEEFLKHFPHGDRASEARAALKDMQEEARAAKLPKSAKAKPEKKSAPVAEQAEVPRPEQATKPADAKVRDDAPAQAPSEAVLVTGIRHWSTPDYTRVAVDLGGDITFVSDRVSNPERIYFDLHNSHLASTLVGKSFDVQDGFLHKIRVAQFQARDTRVVLEVDRECEYSAFLLPNPSRLIIDIRSKHAAQKVAPEPGPSTSGDAAAAGNSEPQPKEPAAEVTTAAKSRDAAALPTPARPENKAVTEISDEDRPAKKPARASEASGRKKGAKEPAVLASVHEAKPTANGDRSLIRALGLKIGRIVVDAGHGGHDTGTIGPNGLLEKDLVLDVALRLGKLLEERLGAEVVYTRDDDTFVPLETRTAIANQNQADLFISVHANSSRDASARGVETYYLNFTTSADALEVAARENAVSEKSIHELQDLVKKIALKEKVEESQEFAADVQKSLAASLKVKNRGVKQAPFIVLIGANMPSILAEISFVSNPTDAKKLKTEAYRQKIAEALYRGVAKYVSGLSGLKVAAKTDKPTSRLEKAVASQPPSPDSQ